MTMTLAIARTRVRFLVDDPAPGVRVLDADIDDALLSAQAEVWAMAVSAGSNIFQTEALITTASDGSASLVSIAPQRINQVGWVQGQLRSWLPAIDQVDAAQEVTGAFPLVLFYVPRVTFPSAPGNNFVWGPATLVTLPQLDKLMVAIAASELKIIDAEVLAGLETRKQELKMAIAALSDVPRWERIGTGRRYTIGPAYGYYSTGPDAIQLVFV